MPKVGLLGANTLHMGDELVLATILSPEAAGAHAGSDVSADGRTDGRAQHAKLWVKLAKRGRDLVPVIGAVGITDGDDVADATIAKGQDMLRQIRAENAAIPDEVLSGQMDELDRLCVQIFKTVSEKPQKASQIRKFMNYYLPTTLKLLENYASFEEAGVSGENLSQAKAKIEKTMDSIVAGFEHQLDELYRTDAMDIDSDIRVMETMLRRDTASVADDFGLNGGSAVQQKES